MKVRLLTIAAGAVAGNPDDVLDLDADVARGLVTGGFAVCVDAPAELTIETATAEPVAERAVKPRARKRRVKK